MWWILFLFLLLVLSACSVFRFCWGGFMAPGQLLASAAFFVSWVLLALTPMGWIGILAAGFGAHLFLKTPVDAEQHRLPIRGAPRAHLPR